MNSWNWGLLAFITYIFCELVQYQLLLFTSNNLLYNWSSGGWADRSTPSDAVISPLL